MLPSRAGFGDDRQRFHVEINVNCQVSWKKLLNTSERVDTSPPPGAKRALEARIAPEVGGPAAAPAEGQGRLDSVIEKIERMYKGGDSDEEDMCQAAPHADDYNTDDSFIDDSDLDDYFEVDGAQTKYSGFFINKGALESSDQTEASKGVKRKKRERDPNKSSKKVKVSQEPQNRTVDDKKVSKTSNPSSPGAHKIKEASRHEDSVDVKRANVLNLDGAGVKASKTGSQVPKDGSPNKQVEKTIQELEKAVFEFLAKQPEVDPVQPTGVKNKRLPVEVKSKLAKVARLSGKVSDELVERLMKSVGRFMQVKTLKKNLKEMIELGLTAKSEKDCKVGSFKEEIKDMITSRIPSCQSARDSTTEEEQQDAGANVEKPYEFDVATEDRICEFYEFYLDGMDEHKGAPSRKFYTEVAELWPAGWMDNNGIKTAVLRAKERKKGAKKRARLEEKEVKKRRKVGEVPAKSSLDTGKLLPCSSNSTKDMNVVRKQQASGSGQQEASTDEATSGAAPHWDQHSSPPPEGILSSCSLRRIKKELSKATVAGGKDCSSACLSWQQHQLCEDVKQMGTLLPEPSC